ncbi:hypothetical protein M378DRAFT_182025 [Amanita muscaria Koide BX008]|uniref:Uncharacterized protein n=1 Tax=Amanita muscaria (strain Koide BX008) TaxID=946122 RepID=A0A0C2S0R9_AMAMK|nr:hypothetical protein M378DRAFT_182025 [Amanita muscaria Koide BX008]
MSTAAKKSSRSKGRKTSFGSKGVRQPHLYFKLITRFLIPTHSWTIDSEKLVSVLKLDYSQPEQVQRMGQPLLLIEVTQGGSHYGYLYVPPRYGQLWRHLRYNILYWEKAFKWYEEKLTELGPSLDEREAGVETLRDNAGVKYGAVCLLTTSFVQLKFSFENLSDLLFLLPKCLFDEGDRSPRQFY